MDIDDDLAICQLECMGTESTTKFVPNQACKSLLLRAFSQWRDIEVLLRFQARSSLGEGVEIQSNKRLISMNEVSNHQKEGQMWTVLKGLVYNISPYVKFHPGGTAINSIASADILKKAEEKIAHLDSVSKNFQRGLYWSSYFVLDIHVGLFMLMPTIQVAA
ncbi:unnamed protein product [Sphenostylis stenocarpa]|uniref:Cytochrome b5 heme-binding domain-containing protein n=1 Tax=Sphenostylis stenocarpa TaxID=92480 RepID=A0AA86RYN6_9FABA|nr:unnamed protein product [Sphenostylis stenocarpa]